MVAREQAATLGLGEQGVVTKQPNLPGSSNSVRSSFRNGPESPPHPRLVSIAVVLLWATALMQTLASVIATVYATSDARRESLLAQLAASGKPASKLEMMVSTSVVTVVVACIVTVGAYLVIAHFVGQGRSWARTLGAALALLTLVQLVGLQYPTGYPTLAQTVFGALAMLLCYLPGPNAYFAAVKESRNK
ncbi:hypothetical protein AOC05_12400 [Arthrobacter alpinus]|uniref:Uncharacterized protein n=1 Tax=Arthrobacter alpinus TaxID=656366 RepID=A0A0M5LXM4_9MICC|nr:hypothetical protein [Arthrobacter sp. AQ5-05]ALE92912.1 hypothetical protein AOC05_12400 [Arthrobacter alpinus]